MIATDGVGPPGPEMRSPSGKLGRREVSIERTTIDIYPAAAQLSSALSRLTRRASRSSEALQSARRLWELWSSSRVE